MKGGGNDIRGFRVCLLNVVFMHTFGAPFPCEDYVLRKGGKTHHFQNMKTTFHEQPRKSLISIIYIYIYMSWELPVERPKKRIIETKWQLARWPPTRARSEPEEDIKLHYWSESGVGGRGRKPFNIYIYMYVCMYHEISLPHLPLQLFLQLPLQVRLSRRRKVCPTDVCTLLALCLLSLQHT